MQKLPMCSFLSNSQTASSSVDSPLQLKLINYLGLKKYMMDNFIFKRKPSKYFIGKKNGINTFFTQTEYQAPEGYTYETKILQTIDHSIPVLRLIPKNKSNNNVIIYAHGNASDLSDSLSYVNKLSQHIETEYVIFDYTGYGQSRLLDVGEEIICRDLQIVLAWVTSTKDMKDVILWGFSLGTFPVLSTAAKYPVKGVLLQCPIASIACIFHKELHSEIDFQDDHFSNIKLINKVKSRIFITHSAGDEIIPFNHAKLLFDKFVRKNGHGQITFIEVAKIKHNSLHRYITSQVQNELQKQVFQFITGLLYEDKRLFKKLPSSSLKSSTTSAYESDEEEEETIEIKELRAMIKQSEIEDMMDDMNQIVIEEKGNNVVATHRLKGNKGCFCFSDKM